MTTLRELAARRAPKPPSYAVRVWDPVRITWVVDSSQRFSCVLLAEADARQRVANGGKAQVVEASNRLKVMVEVGS